MIYDTIENNFEEPWRTIFQKYASLASDCESKFEDAAHWYGEQANTSLLSAAAWMCGFPNLCEMSEVKRIYNEHPGAPRHSYGRIDMFLYLDDDSGAWIEAKKVTGSMDLSTESDYQPTTARLSRWLSTAYDSSEQNRPEARCNGGNLCSLVFCGSAPPGGVGGRARSPRLSAARGRAGSHRASS